ncbi:MAG: restriction endonuclease subunit S [[Pasteurella] aerogenes]|nr:restriction endonuclease subunit S [[Pasteurella] aerogenes]
MSSWELKKLSEVADIIGGATPKSDVDEYFNGDIPWITPKDLSGYKNRYISKGERNITKLGLENSSAKLLPKGAVLFTSRAPIGYVAIADNEVSTNQGFKSLVLKDGNIPEFFYYLLKHNIPLFEARATGSTFKEVSGQVVKNTELLIPSIDIQKKIVDLVSPLDEKIELNTQINQTLEQIAQTIFKSWFIDFDPVHVKANALASGQAAEQATQAAMAVISGKNTQELHRLQTANPEQYQQLWEIAEAFPSGFDEEGVPRGWEEKFFGELLENTIGGDWGKDEVDEKHTEKVSILRGTDLPDVYKGNDKDVPTRFVEQKKLKSRKLQYSDIVIEVSGGSKNQPTGRSLLITDKLLSRFNNPIVPASFCRLFRPKSENYGYLLALHLQIIYQQGKTWEYQNQSTGISNFQTTHFLETEKVILPTNKTLMYFAEMVNPIFDKIYSDENQRLAEIRDELLPKLLSGEV